MWDYLVGTLVDSGYNTLSNLFWDVASWEHASPLLSWWFTYSITHSCNFSSKTFISILYFFLSIHQFEKLSLSLSQSSLYSRRFIWDFEDGYCVCVVSSKKEGAISDFTPFVLMSSFKVRLILPLIVNKIRVLEIEWNLGVLSLLSNCYELKCIG